MQNIKLDKAPVFVFLNKENIIINSNYVSAQICFKKHDILNISTEILILLLKNKLDEMHLLNKQLIIILNEDFYTVSKTFSSSIKSKTSNPIKNSKMKNIFNNLDLSCKTVSSYTEYIYNSQTINNFEALPFLQEFYISDSKMAINEYQTEELKIQLDKRGFKSYFLIPYTDLISSLQLSEESRDINENKLIISIHNDYTFVSTYKGLYLKNAYKIQRGIRQIINSVSNRFNVSSSNAFKLIEMYGFVFLPKKYINFVIDVPVYDDITLEIELTELSFIIREEIKELFSEILNWSSKLDVNQIYFNSEIEIAGMTNLIELMSEATTDNILLYNISYNKLQYSLQTLYCEEEKLLRESQQNTKEVIKKEITNISIREKLTDVFNMHIKPLLLDPEI